MPIAAGETISRTSSREDVPLSITPIGGLDANTGSGRCSGVSEAVADEPVQADALLGGCEGQFSVERFR